MSVRGSLFILSAPSGAGKTSLARALVDSTEGLVPSVSATTRAARAGELNGSDYLFMSAEEFDARLEANGFLEHARVYGHAYGTPRDWVEDRLGRGLDVLLEIDWQGARQVRRLQPDAVSVFILPPSLVTLTERLAGRATDSPSVIAERMRHAREQVSHYEEFDFLVINDIFESAVDDLKAVVRAQRLRRARQVSVHGPLIREMLAQDRPSG